MVEKYKSKDYLEREYVEKKRSTIELAKQFDLTPPAIVYWLESHNIERRGHDHYNEYPELRDEEYLEQKYVKEDLTAEEIADIHGCDVSVVTKRLRENDIVVTMGYYPELNDEEWLRRNYKEWEKSQEAIANELGATQPAVKDALKRNGIETRGFGHDGMSGEENPRWNPDHDGEFVYGSNWEEQRKKALERDGYKCRACGKTQKQHVEEYGRGLDVHHLIPIREFEKPESGNDIGNLVSACRSCHLRFEGVPVFPNNKIDAKD